MRVFFPLDTARRAGWILFAFLLGVGLRSYPSWVYYYIPSWWWLAAFVVLAAVFAYPHVRPRWIALLLFMCLLGAWRVEVAPQPKLRRIGSALTLPSSSTISTEPWKTLERWRKYLTTRLNQALPSQDAGLIAGILYGDEKLSRDDRAAFRMAGLMHLVAVSGSNVTIVVQSMFAVTRRARVRRRKAFVISSCALIFFVGMVGFSASVLRAACMGWLMLLAREFGRLAHGRRLLVVAAFVLVMWEPYTLWYSPGFALSFLAMWGLLDWAPRIEKYLEWIPETWSLRTTIAATIAATLLTAPYLAWMFQRVALAGLITNILAAPLIPWLMALGSLSMVWGGSVGHEFLGLPAAGLSRLLFMIAHLATYAPWAELQIARAAPWVMVAAYGCMAWWFVFGASGDKKYPQGKNGREN